jgi:hypothetical protein
VQRYSCFLLLLVNLFSQNSTTRQEHSFRMRIEVHSLTDQTFFAMNRRATKRAIGMVTVTEPPVALTRT